MTTPERRQILYSKMLQFMTSHNLYTVPIDLKSLCQKIGVDLIPLSDIVQSTGLSAPEIFSIWGNEDGAVNALGDKHRITFNDHQPPGRVRFTICEELSHMIFGHTKDPGFNVFQQQYELDQYLQFDEEARLGAGILVCHPKFFYTYERLLIPECLSEICHISLPCAVTRCEVYGKYKKEITDNISYQFAKIPHSTKNLWSYEKRAHLYRSQHVLY